ncbi:hypothetical protein KEJ27_08630 [Candidatus Bathyarchaeota archaeon]|nr:hypothetical protein [Candidatus Bathyarchaeota archaeon]
MRLFRDRDFLETYEGMFFCVIGNVHPEDRVISYLKYVPSDFGLWGMERKYSRILKSYTTLSVKEVLNFLKSNFPHYVSRLNSMGLEMIAVPVDGVKTHFKPELRLRKLYGELVEHLDVLERRTIELVDLLSKASGIPVECFGVTGSILLKIHNPSFSDVDLTVYGRRNASKIKEALAELKRDGTIRWLNGGEFDRWVYDKARQYGLSLKDAWEICRRVWSRGIYAGTEFSVHPVKIEEDSSERYGDFIYKPTGGLIKVKATIVDIDDSYFMPAVYKVSDVEFLSGFMVEGLTELTTYEGFYAGIFEAGEVVEALGKLETVLDNRGGETYHRLVVGSFEAECKDYIKPIA